ncbi:DNA mismatch endonuclease Vsr [Sphingomonas rosea]|uniref:Very short patch repair endonuclease n=1 Tax=Sphingomonas rosea TaxID=335605 RepID=A0ABP7U4C0_9SPHN
MDRLTPERRSRLMSRVPQKNTSPELRVRRAAHALGLRFRIHRRNLPGTPDLVFPKYKVAIFVHGCFWHRHPGCPKASVPKTRQEFWEAKFARNVERDRHVDAQLSARGWRVCKLWECETKDEQTLRERLVRIFGLGVF